MQIGGGDIQVPTAGGVYRRGHLHERQHSRLQGSQRGLDPPRPGLMSYCLFLLGILTCGAKDLFFLQG